MPYISVSRATKVFDRLEKDGSRSAFTALRDVSLEIERGEFVCLLGFSGCGKSTLLNLLAGFDHPTDGSVEIEGCPVVSPSPRRVTIFQDYGLLPWRNVLRNVELGLEERKDLSRAERREIARKHVDLVGLSDLAWNYPVQLSGGQRQRVAIARGLAVQPEALFMDEPFGALDPITRNKLQDDLLAIVKERGTTVVFVTHDIEEAVYLADRIVVMAAGPGRIASVHSVDRSLPRPREHNSSSANALRRKIYDELHAVSQRSPEYAI